MGQSPSPSATGDSLSLAYEERIRATQPATFPRLQAGVARRDTPVEELQQPLPEEFPQAGPPQEFPPAGPPQEFPQACNQEPQTDWVRRITEDEATSLIDTYSQPQA